MEQVDFDFRGFIVKYFPELKNNTIKSFGGLTSERLVRQLSRSDFNVQDFCNVIIRVGTTDICHLTSGQFRSDIISIINLLLTIIVAFCCRLFYLDQLTTDFQRLF